MSIGLMAGAVAGGMAALYGLDWYKNRRKQNKTKKSVVEKGYVTTKQEHQPVAEQLA
jgi:hypothetical protein